LSDDTTAKVGKRCSLSSTFSTMIYS